MNKAQEKQNLVLTGFMGTGKSTVGLLVADRLRWKFVDADEEIEGRFGLTIPEIFARHGEAGFRRFESIVCQSLAARRGLVIATGGGMLVDSANRQIMEATGLVICLDTSPDILRERLGTGEGRPLAPNWEALYAERLAAYAAFAHHIDTSNLEPEEVADEVIRIWSK